MSNYSKSSFQENTNTSWAKAFRMIPVGSLVLDIGCSSGNFSRELIISRDCIVDGVEIDEEDFEKAKKVLRKVYRINIETDDIDVIDSKYDVIYLGDVIEHLYNPIDTLDRIKKLLKSGGVIVFSLPNMAYLAIRLFLLKGDFDYTKTGLLDKTHIHFYNEKEMRRVFEEAGYTIAQLDYVEKDYPDDLVRAYLKEVGLSPNDNFFKMMHTPSAAAFQFVGVAKIGLKKGHSLEKFGPIDMFESFYDSEKSRYEGIINKMEKEIRNLEPDALKWRRLREHPIKSTLSLAIRKRRKNVKDLNQD